MIISKKSRHALAFQRILVSLFSLMLSHCFAQNKKIKVLINTSQSYQKMDHFGASDAWACQFVGKWKHETKNRIADLLFSRDTLKNGQPKGIGLSLWRFNIGAGSAEQKDASGIGEQWRRAECFLDSSGNYDWNRQSGQMWFLEAAKQRNVPFYLGFTNSPPVFFTKNNKAFAYNGIPNLDESKNNKFTDFLIKVIFGIKQKTGIEFDYISPVNEPQWKWSEGGQEGSPFNNQDIYRITQNLSEVLMKSNLRTKICVPEAGQIDYLYKNLNQSECGNQIEDFFNNSSPHFLGNMSNVLPVICGHSYFTTSPLDTIVLKRKALISKIKAFPTLKYWMSEYCILGDNQGEIEGKKRDLGIKAALYLAKVIHHDLTVANATSWSWWTALSKYDYKDGLIYVGDSVRTERFYASKMLWALGNYSRFIRPEAVRIKADFTAKNEEDCLVSGYKDSYTNKTTLVIINSEKKVLTLILKMINEKIIHTKTYITSENKELNVMQNKGRKLQIPPMSICTVLIN